MYEDGGVISISSRDVNPLWEVETTEASAESDQQWFESQIEQERGKGVSLTNPTSNRNRSNRMTIVHKESGGWGVGGRKSVLNKGREAKFCEHRRKVGMRNPVVGFFLVEEDQSTVYRVIGGSGVAQDLANGHSDISSLSMLYKASLVRRD